jgi:Short C-terminal domain
VSSTPPSRAHRRTALALVVVASLLAFLAIFALWANRQLLDTDNWTETSSSLLEDDDIRGQVATFLTNELYTNVDVQARLRQALPPRADALAGPAAGALRQVVERAVDRLITRPRPQRAWEEANRRAHRRLLQVVEGGGDGVSTSGGNVTLDLGTLLGRAEGQLGIGGRLEGKIPPGAAELTVLRSSQLELAQDVVRVMKALAVVLVVLAIGLFALAVYLARGWRREALRATGIGFVAAGVGALVAHNLAGGAVVDSLATTDSVRPAAESAWSISTSLLHQAAVSTVAYGVVIVVAAWLAGPTRVAVAIRRALAPWLREPRFAYTGLAVVVLLVVAWGPTPATRKALPVLLMIGLLVAGMEALRRQTAREHPDASREDSTRRMRAWASGLRGRRRRADGGPAPDDGVEQLERLARLRDAGVLDASEFEREKRRILDRHPAPAG